MGPARSLGKVKKQRTTLTLPSDSLTKAKNIARARGVNLSTVISEALSEGLRLHEATKRSEEVLNAYRKAFSGFTEVEMALLDGLPRSAAVKATADSEVFVVTLEGYKQLRSEKPHTALKLMDIIIKVLSNRLRQANKNLEVISFWIE